ncbi:MAG: nuclear transport factor 2 family protein [Bacteroidales bacterium]|jgi:ketosteroid isomerase-like protein
MYNPNPEKNRSMRGIFLLISFLLLVSCQMQQTTEPQKNVEETILSLERKALDSWAQGNPVSFFDNFADDASYIDDIGASTRLDSIGEIKAYAETLEGNIPPHNYELKDTRVQVYGDIAILTLQYHSTLNGESGTPWKATAVYHLNDSVWQVVHANWSVIKEE